MKKIIAGFIIGIILFYLSIHKVKFNIIIADFKFANYIYSIPIIILFLMATLLRSVRLAVILSPIDEISQRVLLPITCVGFMFSSLIPLRIGEFVRPYLLSRRTRVPLGPALAGVMVERVFDILSLLCIYLIVNMLGMPPFLVNINYYVIGIIMFFLIAALLFYFKIEIIAGYFKPFLYILPKRLRGRAEDMILDFTKGFKMILCYRKLSGVLLLSFLIWSCFGFGIFLLFKLFNFELNLINAFIVLICTIIAVSIPAAPGMVGNFHFAAIIVLSAYGIDKSDAFSFAVLYHIMSVGKHILLGLIFLPCIRFSFKDVKDAFRSN